MKVLAHATVAMVLLFAGASGAEDAAALAPIAVTLTPRPVEGEAASTPGDRAKAILEIRTVGDGPLEVVADRRLLGLTVVTGREGKRPRRHRCRHPQRVSRVDPARVTRLEAGSVYREWIDLRMYCIGRARRALEAGAVSVELTYGFERRGRSRWIARTVGGEILDVRQVPGTPLALAAPRESPGGEGPLEVTLRSTDVSSGSVPTFVLSVRARGGPHPVYLVDDLWSFRVFGPLGEVICRMPRRPIVPIGDFYRTLVGRVAARATLDAAAYCPEGTFDTVGIYDVVPVLELVYGGTVGGREALIGRFEGAPAAVRVRPSRDGHLAQVPEPGA